MRTKRFAQVVAVLFAAGSADAAGDNYCPPPAQYPHAYYTSIGNPYSCCAAGDCTWWAWKEAADNWGIHLPPWGNASTWVKDARAAGFIVNAIPAPFTIGVNVTQYDAAIKQTDGHLVWVYAVSSDGQIVYTTAMSCGTVGVNSAQYPTSYFTNGGGGFIYPQNHAPAPSISGGPVVVTHSSKNQTLTFYGSNLDKTKVVYVTFPNNAGHAILQGYGQIPFASPNQIELNMTLTTPGKWQLMSIGVNGADSDTFTFTVQ
jgi:surface antigen